MHGESWCLKNVYAKKASLKTSQREQPKRGITHAAREKTKCDRAQELRGGGQPRNPDAPK